MYVGSLWEVRLLQERLEAEGITTYVPEAHWRQIEPFVSWGGPLQVSLQVREEDADHALALVDASRRASAEGGQVEVGEGGEGEDHRRGVSSQAVEDLPAETVAWENGADADAGDRDEEEEDEDPSTGDPVAPPETATGVPDLAALEVLGRRIRWMAILFLTAPIAVFLGVLYILRLPPTGERPHGHALTVGAIILALLILALWVLPLSRL